MAAVGVYGNVIVAMKRRRSVGGAASFSPSRAPNMRGKVAVITGGNTGIGYATAKALAMLGAHVIIACRSEERAVRVRSRPFSMDHNIPQFGYY